MFRTILKPEQCVERPLKKSHNNWKTSQVILKQNQCVKGLLKMNQKPLNLFQIILRAKRCVKELLKNSHEAWKTSQILLKHNKFVKRCHGSFYMSLIILRHRRCATKRSRNVRFYWSMYPIT